MRQIFGHRVLHAPSRLVSRTQPEPSRRQRLGNDRQRPPVGGHECTCRAAQPTAPRDEQHARHQHATQHWAHPKPDQGRGSHPAAPAGTHDKQAREALDSHSDPFQYRVWIG